MSEERRVVPKFRYYYIGSDSGHPSYRVIDEHGSELGFIESSHPVACLGKWKTEDDEEFMCQTMDEAAERLVTRRLEEAGLVW